MLKDRSTEGSFPYPLPTSLNGPKLCIGVISVRQPNRIRLPNPFSPIPINFPIGRRKSKLGLATQQ